MKDNAKIIVYRIQQNGLEVLLVPSEQAELASENGWSFPQAQEGSSKVAVIVDEDKIIELDPVELPDGLLEQAYAVEADWHDIPSLKSILRHDLRYVKSTVKQMVPNMMQQGTFFAVKEAFKRVLPHQYDLLKELKEIISDRNSTRYM